MASETEIDRKTVIITGGNTGLGYECARAIAHSARGWHIILACRHPEKGRQAAQILIRETGNVFIETLEEALQIALQMWSGNTHPYHGTFYQLEHPLNNPLAIQKPHPPILIGGMGEKKTLRLVAQYGDACNLATTIGIDGIKQKLALLRDHCQIVGRPYEAIEKTSIDVMLSLTRDGRNGSLTPSAAIDWFGSLAEVGIDHAIFSLRNVDELEPFDLLANKVIPQVEKIAVAGR